MMDALQEPVSNKSVFETMLAQLQEIRAAWDKLVTHKDHMSSADAAERERDERRQSSSGRRWQPTSSIPTSRVYRAERWQQSNGSQRDNKCRPFRARTRGRWTRSVPTGQDGQDVNNERGRGRYCHSSNQSQ